VVNIRDFGAFVELVPGVMDASGKDGMCHVSELLNRRVENVTDLLSEGDMIAVKVLGIDDKGKVKISRKAVLKDGIPEGMTEIITGKKAKELLGN
ncbi:MAG: S1 RNA-binding domain-containing protein, partial [Clostridiales bacterium]